MSLRLGSPVPEQKNSLGSFLTFQSLQRLRSLAVFNTMLIVCLVISMSMGIVLTGFYHFVQKPRTEVLTDFFSVQISTIELAISILPPAERSGYLQRLETLSDGKIRLFEQGHQETASTEPYLVQEFLKNLRQKSPRQKIKFMTNPHPQLWVEIKSPGEAPTVLTMFLADDLRVPAGLIIANVLVALALAFAGSLLLLRHTRKELGPLAKAIDSFGDGAPFSTGLLAESTGAHGISEEFLTKFSDMSKRLAQANVERQLLLAHLSHDLRSILTRLRLAMVMLVNNPKAMQKLTAHIHEMNRLIGQILDFGQPEEPKDGMEIHLSEVVNTVIADFELQGATIHYLAAPTPASVLRPLAVRRLLGNLIDNALRHAGPTVELRTYFTDGFVRVQVLDRGPGVRPEELVQLTQPYFRTPDARTRCRGSGLGLAIAERIAISHGGFLRVGLRKGGGMCIEAGFPANDDASAGA
ncbi:MAG: ATP-binding protein [Pseudomonadota bacterium]